MSYFFVSQIQKAAKHIGLPEELAVFFSLFIQNANECNQYCCES